MCRDVGDSSGSFVAPYNFALRQCVTNVVALLGVTNVVALETKIVDPRS